VVGPFTRLFRSSEHRSVRLCTSNLSWNRSRVHPSRRAINRHASAAAALTERSRTIVRACYDSFSILCRFRSALQHPLKKDIHGRVGLTEAIKNAEPFASTNLESVEIFPFSISAAFGFGCYMIPKVLEQPGGFVRSCIARFCGRYPSLPRIPTPPRGFT